MSSLALSVGGQPMVAFIDPPMAVERSLRARFGAMATPAVEAAAPVVVRFEPPSVSQSSVVLEARGVRVAADDGQRFYLLDRRGRRAQLPATATEKDLRVDRTIDTRPTQTLHQVAERLLEWQVATQGMVALKGAVTVLPEGGVALVGFGGSGKSSVLLAMLPDAAAYLTEERFVLCGPRTVASWPVPVRLSLGRKYGLPREIARMLPTRKRVALRLAATAASLRPLRGMVNRGLRNRWVAIEPANVFPALDYPSQARLDALVFLLPSGGGALRVDALSPEDTITRVAHHVAYLDDGSWFALRALFGVALPQLAPWVLDHPVDVRLSRLPALLEGVAGWAAYVPPGTSPSAVAAAVRSALSG